INDITNYIVRNKGGVCYSVTDEFFKKTTFDEYIEYISAENTLCIPYVPGVVTIVFAFLQLGIKQEIIDKSIEQGNCVHEMVSNSIKMRNGEKIQLVKGECKNNNHISFALKTITLINSFIYKHKITKIYSEHTFLSFSKFKYV